MVDNKINENFTEFGATTKPAFLSPQGRFGRWFSKFFATPAAPIAAQMLTAQDNQSFDKLSGDTIKNSEVVKYEQGPGFGVIRTYPIMPQYEINRKRRYQEFEKMDNYPETTAAFDIYADDSTQQDNRQKKWKVVHDSQIVVKTVEDMFEDIKLQRYLWSIVRNTVKFGDCFVENVIDLNNPKAGVRRIKILNPFYIIRVENIYGYLIKFLQEIPKETDYAGVSNQIGGDNNGFIDLDKNQIIHIKLLTSDPAFDPYGKSIAAGGISTFRSLKIMEDAMMIYRLSRAPERRIFYIDVGGLPANATEAYIEKIKEKYRKEKFFNQGLDKVESKYNPISPDEDFFVPIRGQRGTKVEVLPGAQNLGEVDDVKYFRDKLLSILKIPKDYVVEKDQSPERKANLSQLDVKFARTIIRIQESVEIGLEELAKRHLQFKGFPESIIKQVKIKLPSPSDMFEKRKMDLDEQKWRVIAAAQASMLVSKETMYKEYLGYNDQEIESELKRIEEDQEQMAEAGMGDPMAAGAPGDVGSPDLDVEAGGQEGDENQAPTSDNNESKADLIKSYLLEKYEGDLENKQKVEVLL